MGWGVHDYPAPPDPEPMPRCPVCGEECETVYVDRANAVVGCNECIEAYDALFWEENQCMD